MSLSEQLSDFKFPTSMMGVIIQNIDEFSSKKLQQRRHECGRLKCGHFQRPIFNYVYRIGLERVKDYLGKVRDESESKDFFSRLERVLTPV